MESPNPKAETEEAVKKAKRDLTDQVIAFLKDLKVDEKEFVSVKKGKKPVIHDKILKAIKDEVEPTRFRMKLGEYGIDYVKREERDHTYGRIQLAVEVDRWAGARVSWLKLLDIRANNNIWIYVPDYEEATEDFKWAVNKIRELAKSRGDNETTVGRFVAVMKRPKKFLVEEIIKRVG